jgi:(E)-4-hydroxy-3-methylbut-2-enyl-diphosphate synthase
MVESALEFARIARKLNFHNFLFSMKSSNPKVMIEAYRLLTVALEKEGTDWNYPLHLGVTEAGDGEDGRIKSAIGIGSLLLDGLGDTIRALVKYLEERAKGSFDSEEKLSYDPFSYNKRVTTRVVVGGVKIGGEEPPRVMVSAKVEEALRPRLAQLGDLAPELIHEKTAIVEIDPRSEAEVKSLEDKKDPVLVTVKDGLDLNVVSATRLLAARIPARHPILLKDTLHPTASEGGLSGLIRASVHLGALLCDGIGDAILVRGEPAPGACLRLGFNILQAAGSRIFKTDYVACPSCGRTLFDLQSTTAKIKAATLHLKGVKIAVMGCIVNGPGEMADADFGYVGGAPGKINLYVGKTPVKFNIPEAEAVDRLKDLIREHGKWVDAPAGGVPVPV